MPIESLSDIQKATVSAFTIGGGLTVGVAVINFGAFPGTSDTSLVITGQSAIVAGSIVNAWLRPVATADHSADEHLLETINVLAGNIVTASGFTVYGVNINQRNEPNGFGPRIYGLWTVAWQWS